MKQHIFPLALVSAIGLFVAAFGCNLQRCSEGADCSITKTTGPSAIPSPSPTAPTPTPTASATPSDPCEPTRAGLTFHSSGAEDRDIAPGTSRQLDFTPYQGEEEIVASCNRDRFPSWSVDTVKVVPASTSVCSLSNTSKSYIPTLKASNRTGDRCIVKASLSASVAGKVQRFDAELEANVR